MELFRTHQSNEFVAFEGRVVVSNQRENLCGDEHNQPHSDDGAAVKHDPQHPRPVLIDLQSFDVVDCHTQASDDENGKETDAGLGNGCTTERASSNHERADCAENDESCDNVAVDAMEKDELVSDDRNKLPDREKSGWKHCCKMHNDADTIVARLVPTELERISTIFSKR